MTNQLCKHSLICCTMFLSVINIRHGLFSHFHFVYKWKPIAPLSTEKVVSSCHLTKHKNDFNQSVGVIMIDDDSSRTPKR